NMKTKKQRQLFITLQQFYQKPVAKVSLELFLSLSAILFFAIFAIRPTLLTMSDLIKEIDDKEKLNKQLSQKIASLSSVQPLYLQLQDQVTILDETIPSQPQLIYSLKIIEKIASELHLVISGINVEEIPKENAVKNTKVPLTSFERIDVPLIVTISGDYPAIRQFVESLRDYRRSFIIDTVIFSTRELRGDRKLEARITVSAPYFGLKEVAAKKL
ncbi:MAG: hypothetical protein HN846_04750, partial [Candidatus Pacebacteria bacterium]|nr:hypothetical protein [Candidatus Paceibacterota bacterium]